MSSGDLRALMAQRDADEAARRAADPRLPPVAPPTAPQIETLPDGRVVAVITQLDQLPLIGAAPAMAALLGEVRASVYIHLLPQPLARRIDALLRDVAPAAVNPATASAAWLRARGDGQGAPR